jgi:hypothetical protein
VQEAKKKNKGPVVKAFLVHLNSKAETEYRNEEKKKKKKNREVPFDQCT